MPDQPAYPDQPLLVDDEGIVRFRANRIVAYLLDAGPVSMNHLAELPFSREDKKQFAQLLGYSVCGYGDQHYVDDEAYDRAELAAGELLAKHRAEKARKP